MRELPGVHPGVETLCTVLKAWSRSRNIADGDERAEVVLKKLNELQQASGIVANVVSSLCVESLLNRCGTTLKF